jgi:hypothetical protein
VVLVLFAGCGSSSDTPSKPSGDDGTPTAQAAVSEAEYQGLVGDGAGAVSGSLKDVRGAGSRSGLQDRLEKAAKSVDEAAAGLAAIKAPQSAAASHEQTVTALKGLSTELLAAQSKVDSGALCTAPAVLAALTRSSAGSQLRSAAKGLETAGLDAGALGPKRVPTPALRLKNGAVLSRKGGTGPGVLIITNGNPREGVVKLVAGGKRMSIYIGRKAKATIQGIPDGNFDVYFASGSSWDGKRNTFSRNCGFTKFERKMKFTSGGGQYTEFRITLNAVKGGNAPSRQIDPDDFPKG